MSFPRYPEYKDSGVHWLGEVPGHWETWKVAHAFGSIGSGTTPPSSEEHWYDCVGTPWVTTGELRENIIFETSKSVTDAALEKFSALRIHPAGSLVVAMYGATIGRLGILGVDAVTNQACCVLSSPRHLDIAFTYYWLQGFKQIIIDLFSTGGGQPNINQDTVASLRIPAPGLSEQTAIATFLDHETAKIDALVAEQQKLIALLQEKRQAVISHAVTKGLDPNVPMKDSGVEWLGEVPAHWEVLPLKRVSPQQTVGIVVNPSEYVTDEGHPFIYGGDISEGRIDFISSRRISPEDSRRNAKTQLRTGDLLTVRVGAPGITAVVPSECEGGNCASVMLVRRGDFNSDWLCYAMNSRVVRYQVEIVQYGAAQEQFNINHAIAFLIPCPPRAEQDALAAFLINETTRLGNLEDQARTAITLLQERRTALISAAVTGQIDVRGLGST